MKKLWITILLIGSFAPGMTFAQQDDTPEASAQPDEAEAGEVLAPPPIPPIPPKITSEEPDPVVRITEKEGEMIEEYSRDGRVYMVKITPSKGLPYYYMDEDGDGQLEIQDSDGQGAVRPVFWKIKEW